jgi:hypothetical protein
MRQQAAIEASPMKTRSVHVVTLRVSERAVAVHCRSGAGRQEARGHDRKLFGGMPEDRWMHRKAEEGGRSGHLLTDTPL